MNYPLHKTNFFALLRLGFPTAPELPFLNLAALRNSQVHSTKGTPPPFRAVTSCRSAVSGSISLPSPGFFSPFPHGTRSLSVAAQYLALDRGRPGFRQGSSCPAVLRILPACFRLRLRGFHALRLTFPGDSADFHIAFWQSFNPTQCGLGSSLFARRYSGNLS